MTRVLEVDWADLDFDTFDVPEGGDIGADGDYRTVSVFDKDGTELAVFYDVRSWKLVST